MQHEIDTVSRVTADEQGHLFACDDSPEQMCPCACLLRDGTHLGVVDEGVSEERCRRTH